MFSISTAIMLPLLLLFLSKRALAAAPGDEYDACEVPDYPVNIKVLLDSWRYQTLLVQDNDTAAVWTTENTAGSNAVSQNCATVKHITLLYTYSVAF